MKYENKCENCKHKYEFQHSDIYSDDIKDFCKCLGCCCLKCFESIPRSHRNMLSVEHYLKMKKYEEKVKS